MPLPTRNPGALSTAVGGIHACRVALYVNPARPDSTIPRSRHSPQPSRRPSATCTSSSTLDRAADRRATSPLTGSQWPLSITSAP